MFNKNDKVRLVHLTGPQMLVGKVTSAAVRCFWFDNNNAPHEHDFQEEDLRKEEAKEPGDDSPLSFGRRGQ